MKIIQAIFLSAALNAFAADKTPDAAAGGTKTDPTAAYRKMDNPGVPESLAIVFGKVKDAGYVSRIKAVHSLSSQLSEPEVKALVYFLHRRISEDKLSPMELNAIKNDIVGKLMAQEAKPVNFNLHLVAMYYDPESDYVWRDYCIQFLSTGYANAWSEEEKALILEALWNATKESDKGIAGTALISLSALIPCGAVRKESVADRAYELLSDAKSAKVSRSTALQTCAGLGNRKALQTARGLALSSDDVPLRMSAIAAVGILGGREDAEMLTALAGNPDNRIRAPAEAALKRIEALNSNASGVK